MRLANTTEGKRIIPLFPYDGGKGTLRNWIYPYIPKTGGLYLEPFAGRGNVFWMVAGMGCQYQGWWLNDIRMCKFFEAIKSVDLSRIPDIINQTEKHEMESSYSEGDDLSRILSPWVIWSGSEMGENTFMGSNRKSSYSSTSVYSYTSVAKAMLNHFDVTLTDIDYTQLPWDQFTRDDFLYIDPPYRNVVLRSYSTNDLDHDNLIQMMKNTQARWVLSEYNHPSYIDAFGQPFAQKKNRIILSRNAVANLPRSNVYGIECLWKNF